ncbi:hypothetical protein IWQ57_005362, partial [Coemansia nantahalensis]
MTDPGERRTPTGWLSVPNPLGLLDRTAKFVLTATHGSRTLLPTSDLAGEPGDTQVCGVEDTAGGAEWWGDPGDRHGARQQQRRQAA